MSVYLKNNAWILTAGKGKTFMLIPTAEQLANGEVMSASPSDDNLMIGRLVGGDQVKVPMNEIQHLYRMGV